VTSSSHPARIPRWALICDAIAVILLVIAAWSALTGGSRHVLFGIVISLRSPLLLVYVTAAVLAVRHVLLPRPTTLDTLALVDVAVTARPALAAALRPFLATRAAVFFAAFFAVVTVGFPETIGFRLSHDPVANLPARFDAGWYGDLALDGYHWDGTFERQRNIAFFPAMPLLMRPLGVVFGMKDRTVPRERRMLRALWAGVVISLAAFLCGLYYVVRLGNELLGPERGAAAAALLASYPFSVYYNAPYTEGLFLAAAAGACFHFGRREWIAASCWGLLAGLTRPNGCFVSVALAVLALQQLRAWGGGAQPGSWSWRDAAVRLAVAATPGIGMLIFTAYLYHLTGFWFAWARSHGAWGRSFQGLTPFTSLFDRLSSESIGQVIANSPYDSLNTFGLLFAACLLWPTFRRLGAAWGLFIGVNIASPLLAGGVLSMGRLTSTLFPLFLSLAATLPPRAVLPCCIAFAVVQGLCAVLFFTWRALY
jgi:hypothetical protein